MYSRKQTPALQPIFIFCATIVLTTINLFSQQITIPRVDMMPNIPTPYEMRDWQQVALGYDSLVFDLNATGLHLPVIWINTNTINYPNHHSFGLHSYVGTSSPFNAEAINVLPAVISATLAGIDKSNHNGYNWVLGCEEFFNRRPQENVYLNAPVTHSGSDWWYDMMPNVFFYQLYDLYPNTGDFAYQFTTVANRWLQAVAAMGGDTAPWDVPYMNYRGWYLETMTPNTSGVPEPEAAGSIAWLLYHAYGETGLEKYRIGAEWAMEFLDGWNTNPAYELQLPYGAYIAARMNAELGTTYNLQKIVNWCFNVGPLRQWGVIVGNWGGYDVHGLVGEASGSGHYAFAMNGFEQVGALVPMVRYDDRFASAIGKWVLNVANASRLFYANYLPDTHQDNAAWAHQFDPNSYIAYEGLRDDWHGLSPYATGDAIQGGWSATNFGLYGSSHVGIPGAIIDTTNVPFILQLDALKTDFFRHQAYPTYLYYNPYPLAKTVNIDVGSGAHDIYDAVSNSFLATGVSGQSSISIPRDAAVLAVIAPAGGAVTYNLDKMLIDGVVVDYRSGQPVSNYPPRIKSLAADTSTVFIGEQTTIYCTAADRDNDPLTFQWSASGGMISGSGATVDWTAPGIAGMYSIQCRVADGQGGQDSMIVQIEVADNRAPTISGITADPGIVDPEGISQLTCSAVDPDGDSLTYIWYSNAGTITGSGASVTWTAPAAVGYHYITCRVEDGNGGVDIDSAGIVVGSMIAYYPFNGNASDSSGFANHGAVSGATPIPDRFGNPNSAYYFDGVDDFVRVPNHPSLNFREAISINFWMEIGEFFSREAYPISHGNWENRWKASITNQRLRWTIKTDTSAGSGIIDLDSQTQLVTDSLYNFTLLYDGSRLEIYINAVLDASVSWGGLILPTTIDLSIGQHLPGNNNYNFKGILDDIRIYNRVLTLQEIQELYQGSTPLDDPVTNELPTTTLLYPNYPNPFNPATAIRYQLSPAGQGASNNVELTIYNLLGQKVRTLVKARQSAGSYQVEWHGRDDFGRSVSSGIYIYRLRVGDYVKSRQMVLLR